MDKDPFSLGGQNCSIGAIVANVPVPVVDVDDADDVTVTAIAVDTGAGAGAVDVVAIDAVTVVGTVAAVAGAGGNVDPYCCPHCKDPLCYWEICTHRVHSTNVGADVVVAGVGAGAESTLKDRKQQYIAKMIRTPPTDRALIEVMMCIVNPKRKRKPNVELLLPLYTRISDHVLRCIIADIFHLRRMEEQLDVLPYDYMPPHIQVRNKDKGQQRSGKKGKETVKCNICGNRRDGCCQCCPDCYNRHRNCTCPKVCPTDN
jgi:hypothetical protein